MKTHEATILFGYIFKILGEYPKLLLRKPYSPPFPSQGGWFLVLSGSETMWKRYWVHSWESSGRLLVWMFC